MKNGDQPINPINEVEKDRLDQYPHISYKGLTKREYFAAMAMQGLIASNPSELQGNISLPEPKYTAIKAVELADALLSELSKTENK